MNEIGLRMEHGVSVTIVSNLFIEKFMADANGSYVKVYLYLLYLVQNRKNFSLSSACDFLEDTEKDVLRALVYWEKNGLLSILREGDHIASLSLCDPLEHEESQEIAHFFMAKTGDSTETLTEPSCLLSDSLAKNTENDLMLIITVAEKYLERCLSPADYNLICDLYEKMRFSSDLIIHLFEYCAGNGKTDTRYIEKVALAWADEGVRTIEQAIESSKKYNKSYHSVIKAFGLSRTLGETEMQYINKWLHSYHMPIEVIVEACGRTLLYVNKPDFKYTDSILKNWYENSCHSLEDIKKVDELFSTKKEAKKQFSDHPAKVQKAVSDFPQRKYSDETLKDLEKKLLKNK